MASPAAAAAQISASSASVAAVSSSSLARSDSANAISTSVTPSTSSATVSTTSTSIPATAGGPSSSTFTTSSSASITSTATQSTSSRSVTKAKITQSTTSPPSSSTSPIANPGQSGATSSNNRLSNGVVAGIVIAVAIGLALLTFLATYLIMRRRQHSKGKRSSRSLRDSRGLELRAPRHQDPIEAPPKNAFVAETSGASETYEKYVSQSADDDTIKQKAKSTLDQIELHIENFYRNSSSSTVWPDDAELAVYNSPFLPAALASLLPRSKNRVNIMKHALAQSVSSSISPSASSAQSLLPAEYALLPNTVMSARSSVSTKAGFTQIMSRWRIMTAYLRPDPTKDAAYIAQRDGQIREIVQSFAKAFAPWKNTGYKDEERARSLSAILEDAANLGIFLFSQPSTLKFHWPTSSEVRPGKIVVSPALIKITDEKGGELVEAQVMVDQVVLDA